jgi:hypothetical protein
MQFFRGEDWGLIFTIQHLFFETLNGANGMSDIEGKATR